MRGKREKGTRSSTTRLSSEEVNKKARNKKVNSQATQVVGKVDLENKKSKKGKKKKLKFKDKHPRIATLIKMFFVLIILFIIIFIGIILGALWGGFNFFDLLSDDFKIDLKSLVVKSENTYIYDADGNELGTLSDGQKRVSLKLKDMGKYLPNAYIAIEDERFRDHSGVDFKRTAAATFTYIVHGGKSSFGGSTITQQVVKNITQEKEDTAMRKVKEMVKALQVEHYLSKDQILELYLNLIFVGGKDVNGVGLGAVYYFNKDVKDLSLAECAYMAAINNSPNSYDPFTENDGKQARIEKGEKRTKTVLAKMKELGYINNEEYKTAIAEVDEGLKFSNGNTSITTRVSYQVDAAIKEIVKQYAEEKGISEEMAKVKIYGGGFKIYTSQKTSIQNEIENEMNRYDFYHLVSNGASGGTPGQDSMACMAIADPKTGEIVACGAGIGEEKSKTYLNYYNYCTDMLKQTGSSIKPLSVLSPGLENGRLTATTAFWDARTVIGNKPYKNEGDSYENCLMTLRSAIAKSQNIPNIKALMTSGFADSAKFCQSVGIKDATEDTGINLALGGLHNGASVVQMASAYTAIANGGVYIEPTFYQKVTDKNGNTIMEPKSVEERSKRVMSEQNAYIVKNVMQGTVEFGTAAGYGKIPNQDTSSKTGTTNNSFDRWYITLTNYYTSATWFGYEYSAEIYWGKTANPAGTIGSNVMKKIHEGLPESHYEVPSGIVTRSVCSVSGMLAGDGCHDTFSEIFTSNNLPPVCDTHQTVRICTETGLLASEYCQNYTETVRSKLPDVEVNGKWNTEYYIPDGTLYSPIPTGVCPHTASSYEYED